MNTGGSPDRIGLARVSKRRAPPRMASRFQGEPVGIDTCAIAARTVEKARQHPAENDQSGHPSRGGADWSLFVVSGCAEPRSSVGIDLCAQIGLIRILVHVPLDIL